MWSASLESHEFIELELAKYITLISLEISRPKLYITGLWPALLAQPGSSVKPRKPMLVGRPLLKGIKEHHVTWLKSLPNKNHQIAWVQAMGSSFYSLNFLPSAMSFSIPLFKPSKSNQNYISAPRKVAIWTHGARPATCSLANSRSAATPLASTITSPRHQKKTWLILTEGFSKPMPML